MTSNKPSDQRQGPPAPESNQASTRNAFVKHLERASLVVQSWPAWKQEILGGTASKSESSSSKSRS